ncbi:MAG: hypothetical protein Q7K57_44600 [Burkholderiaceae bacterium]|nr:hypothetical protein [Burkholderiaceae bacterium]
MSDTDKVAWWGAILATIVFAWDIIKWWKNSTRVRFFVRPDTYYEDSETVPIPGGPQAGEVLPSIHVELNNIGIYPTTVLKVWAERKTDQGGRILDTGPAIKVHFGKKLPYLMTVGDLWSCRIDQGRMTRIESKAPIRVFVAVSHQVKPLVKSVVFRKRGNRWGQILSKIWPMAR